MKLSRFDTMTNANAGVEFELIDIVTGEGSGAFIKVVGTDSHTFKSINAERARAAIDRMRARDGKDADIEEVEQDACDLLSRCTVNWRGIQDDAGQDVPFNTKTAKHLYTTYPVIREQVDRAIADRARFIKG